jgi:hypothetical protein
MSSSTCDEVVCATQKHISMYWGFVFQFLFQEFKKQPTGFLNLILRVEQIEYYLLFYSFVY